MFIYQPRRVILALKDHQCDNLSDAVDKFHWSAEKVKQKFATSLWDGIFLRLLYFVRLHL